MKSPLDLGPVRCCQPQRSGRRARFWNSDRHQIPICRFLCVIVNNSQLLQQPAIVRRRSADQENPVLVPFLS